MVGRSALVYSVLGYSVLVLGAREERDQEIEKKKCFFKGCLKQTSGFVRQLFTKVKAYASFLHYHSPHSAKCFGKVTTFTPSSFQI